MIGDIGAAGIGTPGGAEGVFGEGIVGDGDLGSIFGDGQVGFAIPQLELPDLFSIDPTSFASPDVSLPDPMGLPPAEYGLAESLKSILNNPVMKGMLGIASIANPALGLPIGITQAMASNNPSQGMMGIFGNMMGGMLGNAAAPGLGSITGPALGNAMGQAGANAPAGPGGNTSPSGSGGGGNDWLSGLAGMYANYQGMRDNQKMLGGLQDLYSGGGAYSQQLRQGLERRDAAGGRRSQYGPREVELQAKLAQLASGQIPAMAQLNNNQAMMRALMLKQGIGMFNNMGGMQGLQSLFQSPVPQPGADNFVGPMPWGGG
jgi:hypothetical protein